MLHNSTWKQPECSPMAWETGVQSQVESYQRLKKWYLMLPYLTLSIIRYGSRPKWSNLGKGVASSPTHWCSSCRKGAFGSPSTTVTNFTTWNHLTLCKQMISGSFKIVIFKLWVYKSYFQYMSTQDLALNNLQGLICHKTQPSTCYTRVSHVFCNILFTLSSIR